MIDRKYLHLRSGPGTYNTLLLDPLDIELVYTEVEDAIHILVIKYKSGNVCTLTYTRLSIMMDVYKSIVQWVCGLELPLDTPGKKAPVLSIVTDKD